MEFLGDEGRRPGWRLASSVTMRYTVLLAPVFFVGGGLFAFGLTGHDTGGGGVLPACEGPESPTCGHPLLWLSVVGFFVALFCSGFAASRGSLSAGSRHPVVVRLALTALSFGTTAAFWLLVFGR